MPRAVRVEAKVDFNKRGHVRSAGEVFEADQLTAFLLVREGLSRFVRQITPLSVPAVAAVVPAKAPAQAVVSSEVPSDPVPSPAAESVFADTEGLASVESGKESPQKRYRRRDMKVETATGADEA